MSAPRDNITETLVERVKISANLNDNTTEIFKEENIKIMLLKFLNLFIELSLPSHVFSRAKVR